MVDRKLGRGLDFFLSGGRRGASPASGQERGAEPPAAGVPPGGELETLLVDVASLDPNPNQPRKQLQDADLRELTESIRASGVLQPILARRRGNRLEIVAGERRWRAARLAGLDRVPVLVKAVSDDESAVFALVENLQRADLNAIEKAQAFRQLRSRFQESQEEVARRVGLDRSTVANFMRLLDLTPEVQEHVSRGTLSMGHARALLAIAEPGLQLELADRAVQQAISVRALEALVREHAVGKPKAASGGSAPSRPRERAAWLKEIEETLTETFSTPVAVRYGRSKSVIHIECAGREEFERIYARLKES